MKSKNVVDEALLSALTTSSYNLGKISFAINAKTHVFGINIYLVSTIVFRSLLRMRSQS